MTFRARSDFSERALKHCPPCWTRRFIADGEEVSIFGDKFWPISLALRRLAGFLACENSREPSCLG